MKEKELSCVMYMYKLSTRNVIFLYFKHVPIKNKVIEVFEIMLYKSNIFYLWAPKILPQLVPKLFNVYCDFQGVNV